MTPEDIAKLINEDGEPKPPIEIIAYLSDVGSLELEDLRWLAERIIQAGPGTMVDTIEIKRPESVGSTAMHDVDEFGHTFEPFWAVVVYKAPEGTPLEAIAAEVANEIEID